MGFEDNLIAVGAKKIMKKQFFVALDDIDGEPAEGDIEQVLFIDCNDNPIQPHVWVPPGKTFRCYNEDDETIIKRKIKNKEKPVTVIAKAVKK